MTNPIHFEQELLDALLDRYERSKGFAAGTPQRRRILLRLYPAGNGSFPLYDIEDHDTRSSFNQAAIRLQTMGLIELEWMPGEEGHILQRIALREPAISDAYLAAGRIPLRESLEQMEQELLKCLASVQSDWAQAYLTGQLDYLRKKHKIPADIPSDPAERNMWFLVLRTLDGPQKEPLLERVFSVRTLGDSKAFENLFRRRLISVLQRFWPLEPDETPEDELLRLVGLEKYPEQFSLCGELSLSIPGQPAVSIHSCSDGIQISAKDAAAMQVAFADSVRTLLFIENKANYYHYLQNRPNNIAVFFHGGFLSPQRIAFFKKVCKTAGPDRQLLHWGDIDLGGFQMHAHLRREVDPRFMRYRMDKSELEQYAAFTSGFSEVYAEKLAGLLRDPVLDDAKETLTYMLSRRVRLEQEVLL